MNDEEFDRIEQAMKLLEADGYSLQVLYRKGWSAIAFADQPIRNSGIRYGTTPTEAARLALWALAETEGFRYEDVPHYFPETWKSVSVKAFLLIQKAGLDEPKDWEQFQPQLSGTHV